MKFREIIDTIEFEIASLFQNLKKYDSMVTVLGFFTVIFALYKKYILVTTCIILIIIIIMKKDYESGMVTAYKRNKYKSKIIEENQA
jgi:hypothetical protein